MKGKIKQICILSRDAERTMQNFWDLFGVGPWDVRRFRPETVKYFEVGGKPLTEGFDYIAAVTWLDNIELEVVQPIEGPNVYWDTLERKGECLHHFKIVIEDDAELAAYVKELEGKGLKVTQTGVLDDDIHYYMDTEDKVGFIVELGNGGHIGPPDYTFPRGVQRDPQRKMPNFRQIGALVPNMRECMLNFCALFDVEPWAVRAFRSDSENLEWFRVNGEEVKEGVEFITSVTWAGGIELEYMQPVSGPCVYCGEDRKFIPGLHHVKTVMSNPEIDEELARLEALGVSCLQAGKYREDIHCYMDTKDAVGFLVELGNGAEISGAPDYYVPEK